MKMKRKIKTIECVKCEKMIKSYLTNDLTSKELEIVYNHFKTCSNCMEELTIQFLVSEGIEAVDTSDDYNLVKNLNIKLNETERRLKRNRIYTISAYYILGFVGISVVGAIIALII